MHHSWGKGDYCFILSIQDHMDLEQREYDEWKGRRKKMTPEEEDEIKREEENEDLDILENGFPQDFINRDGNLVRGRK